MQIYRAQRLDDSISQTRQTHKRGARKRGEEGEVRDILSGSNFSRTHAASAPKSHSRLSHVFFREKINSFLVFDRWGNTVFEASNFSPEDPNGRWDGRYRGKRMNPAVFAYFAVIKFKDGVETLFEGDITLMR